MPPVYAQRNDAARIASSSAMYYGIPTSTPYSPSSSRSTSKRVTSSLTTAKRLTSNNQYYGIPQSNPDTQEPDKEFNGPYRTNVCKDLLERKNDNGETKTPYVAKF